MKFQEYQEKTKLTADFPFIKNNKGEVVKNLPVYQVLGLVGEIGELCEKIDSMTSNPDIKTLDEMAKEAGDTLWYISEICTALGISMEQVFQPMEVVEHKKYYWRAWRLMLLSTRLPEIVKKAWRNDGELSEVKKEVLVYELANVANHFSYLIKGLGMNIEQVMENNIKKLASRKERGVIKSEGDNR